MSTVRIRSPAFFISQELIMNGYERIVNVLNGRWPDRRCVLVHNFMMAAKEAGMTMKQYRDEPTNIAKAHIQAVEKYDLDGVLIDVDTATLAGAVGCEIDYPVDLPARVAGAALKNLEQVDSLKPVDIAGNERVQIWLEAVRLTKKYFGDEKFVRGNCDQAPFSLASMVRGTSEWMMDLIDEDQKAGVESLLEFCTDASCQFVRLMAGTGADMVSNGDSPAGPDLISPGMYREFAWRYEKKVIDLSHDLGLPYMLHICGNTDLIIEDMAALGADAIELDYKTDINLIHEKCADKLTFSGNIDPTAVMVQASSEVVAQKVAQIGQIYKDSPRLIINAGCALPAETPSDNLKALVKAARDLPVGG